METKHTTHHLPLTVHRAPRTAHRAPRTAHRAPRTPRTAHRAPRTTRRIVHLPPLCAIYDELVATHQVAFRRPYRSAKNFFEQPSQLLRLVSERLTQRQLLLENLQHLRDERAAASQLLAATGRVPETLWKRLRALPLSQQCFVVCAMVEAAVLLGGAVSALSFASHYREEAQRADHGSDGRTIDPFLGERSPPKPNPRLC